MGGVHKLQTLPSRLFPFAYALALFSFAKEWECCSMLSCRKLPFNNK